MTAELSGRLVGRTHHFPVRVYYADTDAAGLVYHSVYLEFAERARTEMMRLVGFDHIGLRERQGLVLPVHSCEVEFLKPARLDDLLDVRTTVEEVGGASLRLRQEVWRDSEELVRMGVRLACINAEGKPARIPDAMRDTVRNFLSEEAI